MDKRKDIKIKINDLLGIKRNRSSCYDQIVQQELINFIRVLKIIIIELLKLLGKIMALHNNCQYEAKSKIRYY